MPSKAMSVFALSMPFLIITGLPLSSNAQAPSAITQMQIVDRQDGLMMIYLDNKLNEATDKLKNLEDKYQSELDDLNSKIQDETANNESLDKDFKAQKSALSKKNMEIKSKEERLKKVKAELKATNKELFEKLGNYRENINQQYEGPIENLLKEANRIKQLLATVESGIEKERTRQKLIQGNQLENSEIEEAHQNYIAESESIRDSIQRNEQKMADYAKVIELHADKDWIRRRSIELLFGAAIGINKLHNIYLDYQHSAELDRYMDIESNSTYQTQNNQNQIQLKVLLEKRRGLIAMLKQVTDRKNQLNRERIEKINNPVMQYVSILREKKSTLSQEMNNLEARLTELRDEKMSLEARFQSIHASSKASKKTLELLVKQLEETKDVMPKSIHIARRERTKWNDQKIVWNEHQIDLEQIYAELKSGRAIPYKTLTDLTVATHTFYYNLQRISEMTEFVKLDEIKSELAELTETQNPEVNLLKPTYEDAIAAKFNNEIIYNSASVSIVDLIKSNRMQCYSGTMMFNVAAMNEFNEAKFLQSNPVAILASGHILMGYMTQEDNDWMLTGIETTAAGKALVKYGVASATTKNIRVVDAYSYMLTEVLKYRMTNSCEVMDALLLESQNKYGFNAEKMIALNNCNELDAEQNMPALNAHPFAFGQSNTPPGDRRRSHFDEQDVSNSSEGDIPVEEYISEPLEQKYASVIGFSYNDSLDLTTYDTETITPGKQTVTFTNDVYTFGGIEVNLELTATQEKGITKISGEGSMLVYSLGGLGYARYTPETLISSQRVQKLKPGLYTLKVIHAGTVDDSGNIRGMRIQAYSGINHYIFLVDHMKLVDRSSDPIDGCNGKEYTNEIFSRWQWVGYDSSIQFSEPLVDPLPSCEEKLSVRKQLVKNSR